MSGQFIVLEGIDGSGTTSQCTALASELRARGHAVRKTREPSAGEIGQLVRHRLGVSADLLSPAALALLFAADRLDHLDREIRPALAQQEVVVCDRYVMSSWAYQSLDCDLDWIRSLNVHARWPDLTLVLEVPVAVAWHRVQARRKQGNTPEERFDVPELQQRLEQIYARLARDPSLSDVHTVDGTPPSEQVTQALLERCVAFGL